MSTFTFDTTALPGTKADAKPASGDTTTKLTADDINKLSTAVTDLRQRTELSSSITSTVSPAGSIRLRNVAGDLQVSADGLPFAPVQGQIDVRRFGVATVESGTADTTVGLETFRAHARANPGSSYFFPPGTYRYLHGKWLKDVTDFRIYAYGAKFQSMLTSTQTDTGNEINAALEINPDYFRNTLSTYTPKGGSAQTYPTAHPIATAEAYQPFVVLSTPANVSSYAVGDYVLVYGYCQQDGGYPPNPRFHEVRQVAAVGTASNGAVRFDRDLINRYDSTWSPSVTTTPSNIGAGGMYPAQILNLSNRSGSGYTFTVCKSAYIEGATFLPNYLADNLGAPPNGRSWMPSTVYTAGTKVTNNHLSWTCTTGGTSSATALGPVTAGTGVTDGSCVWSADATADLDYNSPYGYLMTGSCLKLELVNCKIGYLNPTTCKEILVTGCDITHVEIDKVIETITFDKCHIGQLTGGTSAHEVIIKNCQIYRRYALAAPYVYTVGTVLHCEASATNSNAALIEGARHGHIFEACRFLRRPGHLGNFVSPAFDPNSEVATWQVTVLASPAPTSTSFAVAGGIVTANRLAPGQQLFTRPGTYNTVIGVADQLGIRGKRCVVKNVTKDPGSSALVITAVQAFDVPVVAGDVFNIPAAGTVIVNNTLDPNTNRLIKVGDALHGIGFARYHNNIEAGAVKHYTFPLEGDADRIYVGGYLKRIVLNVTQAAVRPAPYGGWSVNGGVRVSGTSGYSDFFVDYKAVGCRVVDFTSSTGVVGSDPVGLASGHAGRWVEFLGVGPETLGIEFTTPPRGYIHLELVPQV